MNAANALAPLSVDTGGGGRILDRTQKGGGWFESDCRDGARS